MTRTGESRTSTLARYTRTAVHDPRRAARFVKKYVAGQHASGDRAPSLRPLVPPPDAIGHAEALAVNGFTVFRGLLPEAERVQLAARLKGAAGIEHGRKFTRTDATVKIPETRAVLFDPRVLDAVRNSVGQEVRFLQVGDVHYLHDTAGWHRDSVHRAEDNSMAADWRDDEGRFGIVKAILYLESENAAMGLIPGSHLSARAVDIDHVHALEARGTHTVVDADAEPNRLFTPRELTAPLVWRAQPGDLLIFDQRLYHCGRRVDHGTVTKDRAAPKFTLSLVFGLDNTHSERFFSYFRYARRELGYRPLPADLLSELEAHNLLLSHGLDNYYLRHPDEIRLAALRNPDQLDALVAEFRGHGTAERHAADGVREAR